MKKRALPIFLVMVLLVAALTVTAMAADTQVAPNNVSEYARTQLSAALATVQTNGSGTAFCPVCNKEVTWYAQGSFSSNLAMRNFHWFIQGDLNNSAMFTVPAGVNCIYLNDHSITSTSIVFETAKGATLNIIGNGTDNEIVQGGGPAGDWANQGETIHPYGGGVTVNLFGGVYKKTNTSSRATISASAAYTLNVYNGTKIEGGISTGSGGNISAPGTGSSINIYGGTVTGGQAANGGNIYANGGTVTISGGSVTGGVATSQGGNIMVGSGTLNISGAAQITSGEAKYGGGNIYLTASSNATISGGTISGGKNTSSYGGGNLCVEKSNATISGTASVSGGTSSNGGSIYVFSAGTVNLTGGTVTGGVASSQGGNIMASAGTVNVSGTAQITGGEAKYGGGNIYLTASSNATISGGTISGGKNTSSYGGGNLCVEGSTATVSGGAISGGTSNNGGSIYVFSAGTVNLNGGEVTGGNATSGNGGNVFANGESNVNINGGTVTGGNATGWGGNFYGEGKAQFEMTSGTVQTGSGKNGGNFGISNAFFTLSGGTIKNGTATTAGGNLYLSGHVAGSIGGATITGGTLEGGSAPNGGSVYMEAGSKVSPSGLTVTGGSATSGFGGNFYVSGAQLTLTDCSVSGGDATGSIGGGNFYVEGNGTGKVIVAGTTTVSGGQAPSGGNFTIHDGSTLEIQSGEISGGTAGNYGGNIYMSKGTLTQTGGTVKTGTSSTEKGGNLYITANSSANISDATYEGGSASTHGGSIYSLGTLTLTDTDVSGGKTTGNPGNGGNLAVMGGTATVEGGSFASGEAKSGGNIYTAAEATSVSFSGTTIENGTAGTGGNAYISGAASFTSCVFNVLEDAEGTGTQIYNDAAVTLNGSSLQDGTVFADGSLIVKGSTVDSIYIRQGTMTLDGAAQINSLNLNKYNTTNASLLVKDTFIGSATVTAMAVAPASPIYGAKLDGIYGASGDFTGKLILGFVDAQPWAFHDDGGLVVGNARTVEKNGDKTVIIWHKNNEEAAKNYGNAIIMYPGNHDLPLAGGNYVVNVSGWNMNVTGTGSVTFYDSANADFKTYGTVTVAENGPTVNNEFATVGPDGNTYYMIQNGNAYSFHRLGVKVDGVSIRPSTAGIYYTSVWQCDDLLKEKIETFGVAVSLAGQPTAAFLQDKTSLYTEFKKDEFVSGESKTSVLINQILVAGNDANGTRATRPIYATAYIKLNDGSDAGLTVVDGGNVNYSLKGVMELIDGNEDFYNANKTSVDGFYNTWKSLMETWDFKNIGKSAEATN